MCDKSEAIYPDSYIPSYKSNVRMRMSTISSAKASGPLFLRNASVASVTSECISKSFVHKKS